AVMRCGRIETKKRAPASATNWAQGGIAAVQDDDDTFASHIQDTLVAGDGLCRVEGVERGCERAPAMIDALLRLGAYFDVAAEPPAPDEPVSNFAARRAEERGARFD